MLWTLVCFTFSIKAHLNIANALVSLLFVSFVPWKKDWNPCWGLCITNKVSYVIRFVFK